MLCEPVDCTRFRHSLAGVCRGCTVLYNSTVLVLADTRNRLSTAILSETYRISSELRSQATAGLVSTTVGDHVGIRGAVGSFLLVLIQLLDSVLSSTLYILTYRTFRAKFAPATRRDVSLGRKCGIQYRQFLVDAMYIRPVRYRYNIMSTE